MDNKKQYIRKGQKVTFSAKLKKGDKSLTSWIVYEGNQCDDDHIIKEEKQVGTEFTFTFEKAGEYTIISYGKREEIKKKSKCINKTSISPKTNNEGKEEIVVDKLDSECAIRLKVIENTIVSINYVENKIRNAVRKGTTDNWELKKGASVTFKANFYIEKPTEEELSSLKMFVLDSNKNILVVQEGNNISFTPENNNEEYTIVAEHITPSGDKSTKKITGKCVLNSVISIKPVKSGELFRPNEEIIFKVDRMKFSADLEDTSRTKWYLNTILKQEGGETYKFSSDKKGEYFVEAANIKPNSSNNKKDPDTCVFKIVDNEVKSISIKGMPKVGRPFELNAKTTFPDLTSEEIQKIKWDIPFNYKEDLGSLNINPRNRTAHFHNTQGIKDPRTIKMTPLKAGTFKVSCRINNEIVEKNIEIVQPKISSAHWIDKDGSSGNILEKAGYYQEMYAYAKHIGLDEEEVILEVYDVTNKQKPIYTSEKVVVPKGSKEICIPYTIKKTYKGKTEEEKKKEDRERKDIQIFFKIKAADTNFLIVSSNKEFENNLLTITNKGDIIDAYFCNSDDSQRYRFVKLNTKIYLKLYVANMIGKEVEVFFYDQYGFSLSDLSQNFNWKSWDSIAPRVEGKKAFYSDKKVIDNKGELLVELNTSKFKKAQNHIHITAVFKTKMNDKEKGAYMNLANHLVLYYEKKLNDIVENVSAIKVAKGKVKRIELEEKKCVCEERIRAFMRMLKIGEGTGELNIKGEKIDPQRGYRIAFGGNEITDFSKHPEKVYNGSSAAGAYQIMQYTWKWLKGERTIKNKKVYDEKGDYCKKYNIQNFDEESQDKLCLAILKHKREGILDLIMKGEIEMAVRKYASLEWASLPHIGNNSNYSFKGKPQPAIPMKDVLAYYEKFYKEELEGKTNLYLKKGFLKEFEINCMCENSSQKSKIVTFDPGLTEERKNIVNSFTISLLERAAQNSSNKKIIITSTIRTPQEQAEAMYNNESTGKHIRYAESGKKVIEIYNLGVKKGDSKEKIISDMKNKIEELAKEGKRVSKHCVSEEIYAKNNIIDISYKRGIKNPRDFIKELAKDNSVTKIIHPLNNVIISNKISYDSSEEAIHIEIKIP